MTVCIYRDIHTLQPYIIDFTQRGCHTLSSLLCSQHPPLVLILSQINLYNSTKIKKNVFSTRHACHTSRVDQCAKRQVPPSTYYRPKESQESEAPRIRGNRHMQVVRLSALSAG